MSASMEEGDEIEMSANPSSTSSTLTGRRGRSPRVPTSEPSPPLSRGDSERGSDLPLQARCERVLPQDYRETALSPSIAKAIQKSGLFSAKGVTSRNVSPEPPERIRVVTDAVKSNWYGEDLMLSSCGISIEKQLIKLDGRVLTTLISIDHPHTLIGEDRQWLSAEPLVRVDDRIFDMVVGSRCWPLVSKYSPSIRTPSPKLEIIDSLYKPLPSR